MGNSFIVKNSPPMFAITFFETSNENDIETSRAYFFEERIKAIVDANPWLAGFIDVDETSQERKLALLVPQGSKKYDKFFLRHFH